MGWCCSDLPPAIVEGLRAGIVNSVGDLAAFIQDHDQPDERLAERLQRVYLRLIRHFRGGKPEFQGCALTEVAALLSTMVTCQRVDEQRAAKRHQRVVVLAGAAKRGCPERAPLQAACLHEDLSAMWRALVQIKEPDQTALWFHVFWGMSYRDIGDALDLSEGTVKSMVSRARKKIRKAVERDCRGPAPESRSRDRDDRARWDP